MRRLFTLGFYPTEDAEEHFAGVIIGVWLRYRRTASLLKNSAKSITRSWSLRSRSSKNRILLFFYYFDPQLLWRQHGYWRRRRDSNSRRTFTLAGFQDQCIKPLCHPSAEMAFYTTLLFREVLIVFKFLITSILITGTKAVDL